MATVYDLKPRFQKLLHPAVGFFILIGFTPNTVTLIALFGSMLVSLLVVLAGGDAKWLLLLPIWLFVRMAFNAIDGMMAREFNLSSSLGGMLNELGDVLSDLVLYLPLALIDKTSALAIVLFSIGAVLTEFAGVLGQAMGAKRHYEGPMGKSDRAFFVGALILLTVIFPYLVHFWAWAFYAALVLMILTCKNRALNALKEIQKEGA